MTDNLSYFNYLRKRSTLGHIYRRHFLYPKLVRYIYGDVLDIGCGIGDFLKYRPTTTGVDINPMTIEWCRKQGLNVYLMKQDILPFPHHSFDCALLDNVIEHLQNPSHLLNEIYRILRSNGTLVVGVPGLKGYASDPDHKHFYDQSSLVSTLSASGFCLTGVFHMPFKSSFLNTHIRQYCIYCVFTTC